MASWWVLSPEAEPPLDPTRISAQARTFFDAELAVTQTAASERTVRVGDEQVTLGRRDVRADVLERAGAAAVSLGGFDVLVARTRSLILVEGPERASLLVASVVASLTLGPILGEDGALLGVRSARARLDRT